VIFSWGVIFFGTKDVAAYAKCMQFVWGDDGIVEVSAEDMGMWSMALAKQCDRCLEPLWRNGKYLWAPCECMVLLWSAVVDNDDASDLPMMGMYPAIFVYFSSTGSSECASIFKTAVRDEVVQIV